MTRISSWLAIVFGSALAILEAVRNWGDWQWWPFWVVDYIAAALLVLGGMLALRGATIAVLTAAWGFTCAMFWMSFFGHLDGVLRATEVPDPRERTLTLIIGAMFAITVAGLLSALLALRKPRTQAGPFAASVRVRDIGAPPNASPHLPCEAGEGDRSPRAASRP